MSRLAAISLVILLLALACATGLAPSALPAGSTVSGAGCGELLANGGFEAGAAAPWVESSNHIATLIRTLRPHGGTSSAFLGAADNADDEIFQAVSLPAEASSITLSYWWSRFTHETEPAARDFFTVTLRNSSGPLAASPTSWAPTRLPLGWPNCPSGKMPGS